MVQLLCIATMYPDRLEAKSPIKCDLFFVFATYKSVWTLKSGPFNEAACCLLVAISSALAPSAFRNLLVSI